MESTWLFHFLSYGKHITRETCIALETSVNTKTDYLTVFCSILAYRMMEHGLLSPERAKKAYERKQKRQQQLRMGTPIKSTKQDRPESSKKPQVSKNVDVKANKRINYSDEDDDFIVKHKKMREHKAY